MALWYAVSKTGQGRVFVTPPERNSHFGIWCGEMIGPVSAVIALFESEGFKMPDIKWEDDPVLMKISVEVP